MNDIVAWKADNGQWAATEKDAKAYERRMNKTMYPLVKFTPLLQDRIAVWMEACFGPEISGDREERNYRFIEESLELVQALGATAEDCHTMVDYVFGRPLGEPHQAVGGVVITLGALCIANSLSMHQAGEDELNRVHYVVLSQE